MEQGRGDYAAFAGKLGPSFLPRKGTVPNQSRRASFLGVERGARKVLWSWAFLMACFISHGLLHQSPSGLRELRLNSLEEENRRERDPMRSTINPKRYGNVPQDYCAAEGDGCRETQLGAKCASAGWGIPLRKALLKRSGVGWREALTFFASLSFVFTRTTEPICANTAKLGHPCLICNSSSVFIITFSCSMFIFMRGRKTLP